MPNSENIKRLTTILRSVTESAPRSSSFWNAFDKLNELSVDEFATLTAAAPRRLGRKAPTLSDSDRDFIKNLYGPLDNATIGFLARFVLAASTNIAEHLKDMITRGGDEEQAAAIMAVNLRVDKELYTDNVVHACRTNSTIVFGAASQNNIYPSKFFSDQEFKQLTIKTIFLGLEFDLILGLEDRFTGDLGKSLTDFFDERRAAGRWLPDSVLNFMKRKGLLK